MGKEAFLSCTAPKNTLLLENQCRLGCTVQLLDRVSASLTLQHCIMTHAPFAFIFFSFFFFLQNSIFFLCFFSRAAGTRICSRRTTEDGAQTRSGPTPVRRRSTVSL